METTKKFICIYCYYSVTSMSRVYTVRDILGIHETMTKIALLLKYAMVSNVLCSSNVLWKHHVRRSSVIVFAVSTPEVMRFHKI